MTYQPQGCGNIRRPVIFILPDDVIRSLPIKTTFFWHDMAVSAENGETLLLLISHGVRGHLTHYTITVNRIDMISARKRYMVISIKNSC